jgi:hypothetical protein
MCSNPRPDPVSNKSTFDTPGDRPDFQLLMMGLAFPAWPFAGK